MTTISDTYGRTIIIFPNADGQTVDYQVTGAGTGWAQHFTVSFPVSVEQDTAIANIEASSMPSALAPAPVVSVPETVSRYQAMAILSLTPSQTTQGGTLLADVTTAVNAAGGLVLLAWENAGTFERNGLFISELSHSLSLDAASLDALFIAAAAIQA